MSKEMENNVRSLSADEYEILAEQNGWSRTFAEGFVSGQMERRLGKPLMRYHRVGIDEFALGFRAGYFERNPEKVTDTRGGKAGIQPTVIGRFSITCLAEASF